MVATGEETPATLLASAFAAAPVGLCVLDGELRCLAANAAFAAVTGRKAAEHRGRGLHELLPAAAAALEPACRLARDIGDPSAIDPVAAAGADPSARRWRWSVRPLSDEGAAARAVLLMAEDVGVGGGARPPASRQEVFDETFRRMPVATCIQDAEWRYVDANDRFVELSGWSLDELVGRTSTELAMVVDPAERAQRVRRFQRDQTLQDEMTAIRTRDGAIRDVIVWVEPYTAGGEQRVLSVLSDITALREARDELARERELWQTVFDCIPVMLAVYRPGAQGVELNHEFKQLTGWSTAAARDVDIMAECFPDPAYRAEVTAHMSTTERVWRDVDLVTRAGAMLSTSWSAVRLSDGTYIGIGLDVGERKQAEAERERLVAALAAEQVQLLELNEALEERVARRTQQVRALASALTLAEQQERSRVSQMLHDDLQQLLYGQMLRLQMLRDMLDGAGTGTGTGAGTEVVTELDEMASLLRRTIQLTRALVVELSPPVGSQGLAEAVHWLAEHMERSHGLKVELDLATPGVLRSRDTQSLLLQMVRELLFNVVKHAGTDRARIDLRPEDGWLVVAIQDEGVGFNAEAVRAAGGGLGGFGLFSIAERLDLIGGRMDIASRPGAGTRVTLRLPQDALVRPA